MNLPFPLAFAIEKSIDAVLRLDPDTRDRLGSINGKTVRLHIPSPSVSLLLGVSDGRVNVTRPDDSEQGAAADTTISGSLSSLRSLLDGNQAVYRGDVTIEGDLGTSQHLKRIMAELSPDWQEAVSPYIGDGLTHRLDVAHARLGQWLNRTRRGARQNTSEYLQEEINLVAPNSEIEHFCAQVDKTRAAADRLTARVQRLEATLDNEA